MTPPELLKSFGQFDLDPCAPAIRAWDTAKQHFTITDNGLIQTWHGRVWLNPPYSKLDGKSQLQLWLDKMLAHRNGMALVNARTETKWFHNSIWNQAHAIVFPKARIRFYRPDGTLPNESGKTAHAIAAFSEADAKILFEAKLGTDYEPLREGKFIPLIIKIVTEINSTWRELVRWLMKECGGVATLEQLYALAADHPKALKNPNFKAKIRQQVQRIGQPISRGQWQATLI